MKTTCQISKILYNIKKKFIDFRYDLKINAKILASYIQDKL